MSAMNSTWYQAAFVTVLYGAVSVAVNFINKYAVLVFPLPATLMLFKTIATLLLVYGGAAAGLFTLPPASRARAVQLLPIALVYSAHGFLVLQSLLTLNVPVYNTIKRLSPVMVLTAKSILTRKMPEWQVVGAVLLLVGGCVVAGAGDLDFNAQGYEAAIACTILQAAYIMLAEHAGQGGRSAGAAAPPSLQGTHAKGAGATNGTALGTVSAQPESPGPDTPLLRSLDGEEGRDAKGLELVKSTSRGKGEDHEHHAMWIVDHAGGQKSYKEGGAHPDTTVSLLQPRAGHHQSQVAAGEDASGAAPTKHRLSASGSSPLGGGGKPSSGGAGGSQGISTQEVLHYVGLLGVPVLACVFLLSGETARLNDALAATHRRIPNEASFAFWAFYTSVAETALTGCMVLCASMTSALTTSVVGVLKGVVAVILGFFLLGGVKFHWLNVTGIAMNLMGGIWYSAVKMRDAKKRGGGGGVAGLG